MKVSTDACILGAWFAKYLHPVPQILDIGSGTGLLMQMLAQKQPGTISGIELEEHCYNQSLANISRGPWAARQQLFLGDARNFAFLKKYDFIISNPPFYQGDLWSPSMEKNLAKHSQALSLEELLLAIARVLAPTGSFGVLLPYHRTDYFTQIAASANFWPGTKILVRQTPDHNYFRSILHFVRNAAQQEQTFELTIQDKGGAYTAGFTELMSDYYLQL